MFIRRLEAMTESEFNVLDTWCKLVDVGSPDIDIRTSITGTTVRFHATEKIEGWVATPVTIHMSLREAYVAAARILLTCFEIEGKPD